MYLLRDLHLELWPKVPWLLLHWHGSFHDIELVLDQLLVRLWHMSIGPCEDILKSL